MRILVPLVLVLGAACASRATTVAVAPPAAADSARAVSNEIHWVRNAVEYRALTQQIYRAASERITELAQGRAPGSWAVILDADETVLDNSEYQRRLAVRGGRFENATWYAWARERAATAVPGATEFLATVRRLGGHVAIVTNRDEPVCEDTRANLARLGVQDALVLCRVGGVSDKNPRYRAVAEGTAGRPAAAVLLWLGDNIQDFPELSQVAGAAPGALALFGDRYFMLPNPMYGSWESLPRR